jgi:hypothetical protein
MSSLKAAMKPLGVYQRFLRPELRSHFIDAAMALNRIDIFPQEIREMIFRSFISLFDNNGIHLLHYIETIVSNKVDVKFTGSAALHEIMCLKDTAAQIRPTWYPRDVDIVLWADTANQMSELSNVTSLFKKEWPGVTVKTVLSSAGSTICTTLKWGRFTLDVITKRESTSGFDLEECGFLLDVRRNLNCNHHALCTSNKLINSWTFRKIKHRALIHHIEHWKQANPDDDVDIEKVAEKYMRQQEFRFNKYKQRANLDKVTLLVEYYEPDADRLEFFIAYVNGL